MVKLVKIYKINFYSPIMIEKNLNLIELVVKKRFLRGLKAFKVKFTTL